jgi:hypothetical protein
LSTDFRDTGLETCWEEIWRYMGACPPFFLASPEPVFAPLRCIVQDWTIAEVLRAWHIINFPPTGKHKKDTLPNNKTNLAS